MSPPRDPSLLAYHAAERYAEQLSDQEVFRASVELLLVELEIATRRLTGESSPLIARRALELLVEKVVTPSG